jgi:3-hydroxybutyryl-CoA dehydrogenase
MNNYIIGVIGAGQMGSGIATLCALHGYRVRVIDSITESLNKAQAKIHSHLQLKSIPLSNVSFHSETKELAEVDIIIEAVPEKLEIKQSVYADLITVTKQTAVIATNTSSFPISQLSQSIEHPARFIGIHFMNPALKMHLVEIIPSTVTSPQTLDTAKEFIKTLNKTIVVSADQPGFIVNRLLIPVINQAFKALAQNLGTKEDIDTAMEKGAAFPMGPFKLADFIGLDTCLSIMNTLDNAFPNQEYSPSELLVKYVSQGKLGRKTNEGVYLY